MKPDANPEIPPLRTGIRPIARTMRDKPTDLSESLSALSAASDAQIRSVSISRGKPRRMSLLLPLIVGLIGGGVIAGAGGLRYRAGATLMSVAPDRPIEWDAHRRDLHDYMSRNATSASTIADWKVELISQEAVRLTMTADSRAAAEERVRSAAAGFLLELSQKLEEKRSTPTEAERLLREIVDRLDRRLSETRTQNVEKASQLPDADPREGIRKLLVEWRSARESHDEGRSRLNAATDVLARLTSEAPPAHGIVPPEERREAFESDAALQQDLKELRVRLTEARLQLLQVWQQTSGPMEQLATLAAQLLETATKEAGDADVSRTPVALFTDAARKYHAELAPFAESWTREFTALRQLEMDPLSGELLESEAQIRSLLGGFLFQASRQLSELRDALRDVQASSRGQVSHHLLESNLGRGFQALQTMHHRFEFLAAGVEPRDNFRLDAALQGARGLRRRTQDRIRSIDHRLQAIAAERARKRHEEDLVRARGEVERFRTENDVVAERLLSLQERLNIGTEEADAFLGALIEARSASQRVEIAMDDLTHAEARLQTLSGERESLSVEPPLRILEIASPRLPANLRERIRVGLLGGAVTFLAVGLGQWWVLRRPT